MSAPALIPLSRPQQIIKEVCGSHRITREMLCGPNRWRRLVNARAEAARLLVENTTLSTPQIGRMLGGRDPTTILNLLRRAGIPKGYRSRRLIERVGSRFTSLRQDTQTIAQQLGLTEAKVYAALAAYREGAAAQQQQQERGG